MAEAKVSPTGETWKPIPSLPGFELSNRYRIRHQYHQAYPPRMVSVFPRNGYLVFRAGYRITSIHRVVYEVHNGPIPPGMLIRHLDGNPSNNRPSNLAVGTDADNHADRDRHGRTAKGSRHGRAILTEKDVRLIRRSKLPATELARQFGVDSSTVANARRGKSWKHIPMPTPRGRAANMQHPPEPN